MLFENYTFDFKLNDKNHHILYLEQKYLFVIPCEPNKTFSCFIVHGESIDCIVSNGIHLSQFASIDFQGGPRFIAC